MTARKGTGLLMVWADVPAFILGAPQEPPGTASLPPRGSRGVRHRAGR
jgi:hypothetical protein